MRLWEVDHPYYATEGCYFARGDQQPHSEFGDLETFLEEWDDADLDMNLVYRWDWEEGDGYELPDGQARFCVFIMAQRKACPISIEVMVTRADEPRIIEWLEPRWERMKEIWEPLST